MIDQQSTNLLNVLEYGLKRGHGSGFDADRVDGIEGEEIRAKQDFLSAGIFLKPTIEVLSDGSVVIGDGEYILYADPDFSFPLKKYTVKGQKFSPGTVEESLRDESVNYIFVSRDAGPNGETGISTPRLHCSTDRTLITQSATVPVATLYKSGTDIHWLDWDEMGKGLSNKLSDRLVRTERFKVETGGLLLGTRAPQYISLSAGRVWYGAQAIPLNAVDSQTDDVYLVHHTSNVYETHSFTVLTGASTTGTIYVGGKAISVTSGNSAATVRGNIVTAYASDPAWTVTAVSTAGVLFTAKTYGDKSFTISFGANDTGVTISSVTVVQGSATGSWTKTLVHTFNNTQYDDATGLHSLNNNYYGVNWIFREVNSVDHNHLYIVLDSNNNQLISAQAAKVPAIPAFLSASAVLVGRIIVQQGVTSAIQIDSAFDVSLGMSATVNHNDLTNIQGGSAAERYHLNATEYSNYVNGTLQADSIQFDTNLASPPAAVEGLLYFDPDGRTLNYNRSTGTGVAVNIGEEMQVSGYNNTATTIYNGTPVRLTGVTSGGIPHIAPADASSLTTAAVIGVATHDIAVSTVGYVTTSGIVRDVNTGSLTSQEEVYLAVGGGLTSSIPAYPNSVIKLGYCLYSDTTNGKLLVSLTSARTTSASFNELRAKTFIAQTSIGVNTATPTAPLEVVGNIKSSDIFITDNNLYLGDLANDLKHNGVAEAEKSKWSLSYNATNRQCTLTLSSASYYYINGKRFDLASGATVFPAHANTSGTYFFYFNSSGVASTSSTIWDIEECAPVSYVLYNSANDGGAAAGILFYEIHGVVMSPASHKYQHLVNGTRFISGGSISGFTLNSDTTTGVSWTTGTATIADEDIYSTIPVQPESNYYLGYFGASNTFNWRLSASLPFFSNGTNIMYNTVGSGLTAITTNSTYVNYYIALTPANTPAQRIIVIPGQTTYTTLGAAQAESPTNLNLSYLPFQEYLFLYQITYVRMSSYSATTGHAAIAANPVKISVNKASLTSSVSDHNLLSNRNATGAHAATAVSVDVANFNNLLSASDINVQLALDTIDDYAIDKRSINAKGDLIVGSADNASTVLPVGTDNYTLITDSSQATGLRWGTLGVVSGGTGATTFAANAILTGNTTAAIQAPGPTLTSTTLTFGGAGTLATTGNLTLSPSIKTTTSMPIEITNATDSSSVSTGALVVSGGVGIAKNLYVGGSTVITGDLTVNGTTVTINSSTINVDDKNIELGAIATPSDTSADGGGITLKGTTDKTILWDDANDNWTSNQNWNISSGLSYKINNVSVLNATTLGSSVINSSLTSVGTLTTGTWSASTIAVNKGGTGITSVTQGGIVYGASASAYGSTAAGTAGQALLSGGTGSPTWTSGTLSIASGKSATFTTSLTVNTGDVTISGNASGSTLILPTGFTANHVIYASAANTLAGEAQLSASRGGTGIGSYAIGDILYASGSATLSKLADVATGNALISGGVTTAPSWGKIGLTTHVSGTLGVANGGTGTSTAFTSGSIVFAGASGVYSQDNSNFFWDDTNDRLGIKTATPETSLHLIGGRLTNGSGNYLIKAVDSTTAGQGVGAGIAFSGKYTSTGTISDFGIIDAIKENATDSDYSGALRFHTRVNGNSFFERMRITSAGSLGINTSAPTGIIHAAHSDYASSPIFERSGQTSDSVWAAVRILATKTTDMTDGFGSSLDFAIQDNSAVINRLASLGAVRAGADNTGDLVFYTSSANTSTEKARITSGGNFVMGATTAAYGKVEIRTTASNTGGLTLYKGTGTTARHWIDANDVYLIQRATTDTLGIAIKATGEVGFGTVSPSYIIDAVGSIRASSQLISSVAVGTAPLVVTSTTLVSNLNSDYLDGQHGSYYTTAGNLTGTIPSAVLGNSTLYVGTTAIALNRASASQSLTGITSIDGSAATLTTMRTLWGQNFNGSANVTGALVNTGTITPASSNASDLGSSSLKFKDEYLAGFLEIDEGANLGFKIKYDDTAKSLQFNYVGV